jgi:hypothetical protein
MLILCETIRESIYYIDRKMQSQREKKSIFLQKKLILFYVGN